jgi:trk system potassium uptake protein TrkA
MLVIGLGHFGTHLAEKLSELGNEVMVVDKDEEAVGKIAPYVTKAQIGNCMESDILSSLGVGNFDVCFVCISDNFQSSLEITSLLKELGAKWVISKADRENHAKFLLKIGADDVIFRKGTWQSAPQSSTASSTRLSISSSLRNMPSLKCLYLRNGRIKAS